MTPAQKDTIRTFAILAAWWALLFSGWVWWEERQLDWFDRPWYAIFPPATALGALAIGAVAGWLWVRASKR